MQDHVLVAEAWVDIALPDSTHGRFVALQPALNSAHDAQGHKFLGLLVRR